MASLSNELIDFAQPIAQRWYEASMRSSHPDGDVGEHSFKDSLPAHLQLIGELLRNVETGGEA